jgi:copper chaperone CopZ
VVVVVNREVVETFPGRTGQISKRAIKLKKCDSRESDRRSKMKSLGLFTILLLFAGSAMAKEATAQIKVSGMTCGACAVSVKRGLAKTKGVKSADVSAEKGLATVIYDDGQVSEQQLREAIEKTGFKTEPVKENR